MDETRAVVERLDAAIVENDDVAVEKSRGAGREFVESMNKTVEAAKAQQEASRNVTSFPETNLGTCPSTARIERGRRRGTR